MKKKRQHSAETIKKMSEKRRNWWIGKKSLGTPHIDLIKIDKAIKRGSIREWASDYFSPNTFEKACDSLIADANSSNVLSEAQSLVFGDRHKEYGDFSENVRKACNILKTLTGVLLTAEQFTWAIIALKLARQSQKHKKDNLVDICGYLHLLSEVTSEDKKD
jgi:hypothetical protein